MYDKQEKNQADQESFTDIFTELKRVADSVSRMDVEALTEKLCEKINSLKKLDSILDNKVKVMEGRLLAKIETSLAPINTANVGNEGNENPKTSNSQCKCSELVENQLRVKENEVSLLQGELKESAKAQNDVSHRNQILLGEIEIMKKEYARIINETLSKTTENEELKKELSNLDNQLIILNTESNKLAVTLNDKDKKIHILQKEIESLSIQMGQSLGQNVGLKDPVNRLNKLLEESVRSTGGQERVMAEDGAEKKPAADDVIILHDSLFKHVTEGIMKKENISVKTVFTARLKDVLQFASAMQEKPKVVVVHCGTNDLHELEETEIVEVFTRIYEVLENRGIKMVFSYIIPRGENILTGKSEVVNSRVVQIWADSPIVPISRNDRFYRWGAINLSLFDDDKIHVNQDGSRALALLTKESICRALNIEMNYPQHQRGNHNQRGIHNHNRRNFRRGR